MKKYTSNSRIITFARMLLTACVIFLLVGGSSSVKSLASEKKYFSDHVIFTAPSAEKIFDGTPLTEQIDVTAQGLPVGFTYKAVAEGSVTFPEDNSENNNVVTDYMIFDPSGVNVTDRFVNVELRPGTLRVSYKDASVLGARRGVNWEIHDEVKEEETVDIEEEETAKAGAITNEDDTDLKYSVSIEVFIYSILFVIMIAVFCVFIMDSDRLRVK